MDSVVITVGMPVWGVEKYIRRCLESILNQNFDQMEILVVDDCGPDRSIEIAEQVKKEHPKGHLIRIIRQPQNMGCWAARNRVLNEAKGKYILLVDSDDYLNEDAIPKLYKRAEETGVEATYGSILPVDENGIPIKDTDIDGIQLKEMVISGEDKLASFVNSTTHHRVLHNFIWNILLRTDFIRKHQLQFRKTKFWDDVLFNADMQPLVTSAAFISDITYCYVIRANSLSNFQERETIKIEEVRQHIENFQYLKEQSTTLKGKSYYETRMTKVMQDMFYIFVGAYRNKRKLTEPLRNNEFKKAISHPLALTNILHFRQHKPTNLVFWLLGKIPSYFSYQGFLIIAKFKHLI